MLDIRNVEVFFDFEVTILSKKKHISINEKLGKYAMHPFFLAVYPILFLLSNNISQINPRQAIRPIMISLSVVIILTFSLGLAARNLKQGALTVTLFLALFFSYGHAYHLLEENIPAFANHLILGALWLTILLLGLWFKYHIGDVSTVTSFLNIVLLLLLIQPITNIASFLVKSGVSYEIIPPSPFDRIQTVPQGKHKLPDIYYIILDGYGRTDVIQELFNYDNSSFISGLKARGFYVAEYSHSNYIQTALSIASSTNLDYLGNLDGTDIQSDDRSILQELIHQSQLRRFLEERGYQTVSFATQYGPTNIIDSYLYFPYSVNLVDELEGLILTTSATRALDDKIINLLVPTMCDPLRGMVLNVFQNLSRVPEVSGPKFVFAHIVAPHPPFVFDAVGNPVKLGHCDWEDGNKFTGDRTDYVKGYPQQLAYISVRTLDVVDDILENSTTPPVIIIQGDHGSGMLLDYFALENTCLRERTSILNAYYIPGANQNLLYESITPVNSFRVLLNEVFALELPLLDDKIYYSTWDRPYQLTDITTKIELTCSK